MQASGALAPAHNQPHCADGAGCCAPSQLHQTGLDCTSLHCAALDCAVLLLLQARFCLCCLCSSRTHQVDQQGPLPQLQLRQAAAVGRPRREVEG
jgi:hypothetical protein